MNRTTVNAPPLSASGLAVLLLATGCGGGDGPKIHELEATATSLTSVSVSRVRFAYENDHLTELRLEEDGEVAGRVTLFYDDDRLDTAEAEDGDGLFVGALHAGWLDGRVVRLERRSPVFFADHSIPPGENRLVTLVTWGRFGPSSLNVTETTRVDPETETVTTWTVRLRYDEEGALVRMTTERETGSTVTELTYDESSGQLASVSERTGAVTVSNGFAFDADGRLERVSGDTDSGYQINYDGDRIDVINSAHGEATTTLRYTYDEGAVVGLRPTPAIPWAHLFDMSGHEVGELEMLTLADLMP